MLAELLEFFVVLAQTTSLGINLRTLVASNDSLDSALWIGLQQVVANLAHGALAHTCHVRPILI